MSSGIAGTNPATATKCHPIACSNLQQLKTCSSSKVPERRIWQDAFLAWRSTGQIHYPGSCWHYRGKSFE